MPVAYRPIESAVQTTGAYVSSKLEQELFGHYRGAVEKYAYFLLAAAGACVGFAVTQSKGLSASAEQAPLGVAVALWGLSFLFGCLHVRKASDLLFTNIELLRLQDGRDPRAGRDVQMQMLGSSVLHERAARHAVRMDIHSTLQFVCLILGVISYLAWHVLVMWRVP